MHVICMNSCAHRFLHDSNDRHDVSNMDLTFSVNVAKSDGRDGSGKTDMKVIELIKNDENMDITNDKKKNFVM